MTTLQDYIDIANSKKYAVEFHRFKHDIFSVTLKWEGGGKLHNVEGDTGGWTVWGIAYNHNKGMFKDIVDFKDTTYEEAAAVAFVKYYLAARANLMRKNARLVYFDMTYNLGVSRAIKIMQTCAGVKADGIIGPVTMSVMKNVSKTCLYENRVSFYNTLVKNNIALKKFIKGWLNRANDVFNV